MVIYYYGYGDSRTCGRDQDLGTGPFKKFSGTVLDFDKHDHTLSVQTQKAGTVKFDLGEKVVVDTGVSLLSGQKYSPHRGSTVRVTATGANGGMLPFSSVLADSDLSCCNY